MRITPVTKRSFDALVQLGCELWPDESEADMRREFARVSRSRRETAFLCWTKMGEVAGFVQVCLRLDYVEESNSSPVGYLEGLYVRKPFRRNGVAKLLVEAAEAWARSKGATEMGSDAHRNNLVSRRFHAAAGYRETKPIVHFIKKLQHQTTDPLASREGQ